MCRPSENEMISLEQYFRGKKHSPRQEANAISLLEKVLLLLSDAATGGAYGVWVDPDTGTRISGAKGGAGDGGFRAPDSKTGSKTSSHRDANGIDIYDPNRVLAAWCVLHKAALAKHGLYMEDPRWTPGWVHLQRVPPGSGKLIYIPSKTLPLAKALPGQGAVPLAIKL